MMKVENPQHLIHSISIYMGIQRGKVFIFGIHCCVTKYSDLLQKRKFTNSKSLVLLTLKMSIFPFLYSTYTD